MLHTLMHELEEARKKNEHIKAVYLCHIIASHDYDEWFSLQIKSIAKNIERELNEKETNSVGKTTFSEDGEA